MKWTDLPANAQVDAALRRAAAGVPPLSILWKHICIFEKRAESSEEYAGSVSRFASLVASSTQEARALRAIVREQRAAICGLLDLLGVPVPERIE